MFTVVVSSIDYYRISSRYEVMNFWFIKVFIEDFSFWKSTFCSVVWGWDDEIMGTFRVVPFFVC